MSQRRFVALMTGMLVVSGISLLPAPSAAAPRSAATDPYKQSLAVAIDAVTPALVRIHVVNSRFYSGREIKLEGYGSGVIISPQGHVITNHHVAGDASKITCTLSSKEEVDAVLIGTDPLTDIAVLQLRPATPRTFPTAEFADSSHVRVGDRIFAMGSPLAFSQSVTMGVVSNTALILPDTFGDDAVTLDGENVGSIVRWIGHDAEIFPGNSGGPLVNDQGKIVGINEISIGLSGAIPGNLAKQVADQLISQGRVTRSTLGIAVQPLLKSSSVTQGVLITGTEKGAPAADAGMKVGDILVRLNSQPVAMRFKEEMPLFNQMEMSLPIGKSIPAVIIRDGKEIEIHVTPRERQGAQKTQKEFKVWGFSVENRPRTPDKDVKGVRISGVRTGSPADSAKPPLASDDVLLAVNGSPVTSIDRLAQLTDTALTEADGEVPVLVSFQRGEDQYLTVVKLGEQEVQDRGREIRKAWLPVNVQVLTKELAKSLHLEGKTGVRITQIYAYTSSKDINLRVGDIIFAIDGMPIEASQPEDTDVLAAMIRQYKIGSIVELDIMRGTETLKVSACLPEAPKLPREMKKYRDLNFDFAARDLAFIDRASSKLSPEQAGVLVESVTEGSWAALGRLKSGDVIERINNSPIHDVVSLTDVMSNIAKTRPATVLFQVRRSDQIIFLEIHGNWTK